MIALLAQLFLTFFLIGMFTFGGGYAMLSLIQAEVVVKHAWLSESMFADIVAISQMTPGPIGINCATYVGYDVLTTSGAGHLMGIVGSLTATLAITPLGGLRGEPRYYRVKSNRYEGFYFEAEGTEEEIYQDLSEQKSAYMNWFNDDICSIKFRTHDMELDDVIKRLNDPNNF